MCDAVSNKEEAVEAATASAGDADADAEAYEEATCSYVEGGAVVVCMWDSTES